MNRPQYRVGHLNMPPSQASTLLHYFLRPADPMFDDILYVTYATDFITSPVPRPGTDCPEGIWWHEARALPNVPPHIVQCHVHGEKVARIRPVRPGMGEVFYIRLHHAARSFEDLRTIKAVHESFGRSAKIGKD